MVSIFEEHTNNIVKGSRDVQYGHKLNLSTWRSGSVLDVVIEIGNPADSELFLPMLDRHIKHYGKLPRQMAAMPASRIYMRPGRARSRMWRSTRNAA